MKEIIEYVLAALIVISFIPIYDTVINNILRETPIAIDQSILVYISSSVRSILVDTFSKGNFTVQLTKVNERILNSLNLSTQYGLGIKIYSSGILGVFNNNGIIKVYTSSPGRLYLCIVYSDLSYTTVSLDTASGTLLNGTIYYTYSSTRTDIIFVSAIIETGVARFIGYWVSDNIYKGTIVNINNNVILAIPTSAPSPNYISLNGLRVLNVTMLYFTNGVYHVYDHSNSKFIINLTWSETWQGLVGHGYYKKVSSRYISQYYRDAVINAVSYHLLKIQDYVIKRLYSIEYETSQSDTQIYEILIDKEEVFSSISYPIYNLVSIFAKDRDGKIYYALVYPHSLYVGENHPQNWPVYKYSFNIRIGMINYDVDIFTWRRYIG